jgi:ubiquinone/menaquinone biosynthesis C-methylase UbiE
MSSEDDAKLDRPTQLPASTEEASRWQTANRSWWQANPMRYDWNEKIQHPEFSAPFFQEIDRRFFDEVRRFMPWRKRPFEDLIPFDRLRAMDVLEIGVGNGSHAQLLAANAKSFTGIDLTEYAVKSTAQRLAHAGLSSATVRQMDAERLEFPDESFDFIWSWGVIHHSSNTREILREMARVLRPGGTAVVMVYHRSFWLYYVTMGLIRGVLLGELVRTRSLSQIVQRHTDGAIARYYTPDDWTRLASEMLIVKEICVYGAKPELLPMPRGRIKRTLMKSIPDSLSRFFLNRLGWGSFLVSRLERRF